MSQKLLEVRDLKTYFRTEAGMAKAVDGVSFDINVGEVIGLVGESGSGKSVTALSVLRLIPDPPGKIVGGQIIYKGQDLLKLSWEEHPESPRQRDQHDLSGTDDVAESGADDRLPDHGGHPSARETCRRRKHSTASVQMLELVGIPDPASRMNDYPHQFSGGMRQRVMIAMALACDPSLLIADEPTTALDVTIQAQILELMLKVKEQRKNAAILLITHNLAVVAETCDRVMVMYGGKIQEIAPVRQLFKNPLHPYTRGLLASLPTRGWGQTSPVEDDPRKRSRAFWICRSDASS